MGNTLLLLPWYDLMQSNQIPWNMGKMHRPYTCNVGVLIPGNTEGVQFRDGHLKKTQLYSDAKFTKCDRCNYFWQKFTSSGTLPRPTDLGSGHAMWTWSKPQNVDLKSDEASHMLACFGLLTCSPAILHQRNIPGQALVQSGWAKLNPIHSLEGAKPSQPTTWEPFQLIFRPTGKKNKCLLFWATESSGEFLRSITEQ